MQKTIWLGLLVCLQTYIQHFDCVRLIVIVFFCCCVDHDRFIGYDDCGEFQRANYKSKWRIILHFDWILKECQVKLFNELMWYHKQTQIRADRPHHTTVPRLYEMVKRKWFTITKIVQNNENIENVCFKSTSLGHLISILSYGKGVWGYKIKKSQK